MHPAKRFRIERILGSSDSADFILYLYVGANKSKYYVNCCGGFHAGDVINFVKIHVFGPLGGLKIFFRKKIFCSILTSEQCGMVKKIIYWGRIFTLAGCDTLTMIENNMSHYSSHIR